jgi:pilin isopeptide linkage protein
LSETIAPHIRGFNDSELRDTPAFNPNGYIYFPELFFDRPGEYIFKIKALTPNDGGWIADGETFRVLVRVSESSSRMGALDAAVEYPDGFPEFVNVYEYQSKDKAQQLSRPSRKPHAQVPSTSTAKPSRKNPIRVNPDDTIKRDRPAPTNKPIKRARLTSGSSVNRSWSGYSSQPLTYNRPSASGSTYSTGVMAGGNPQGSRPIDYAIIFRDVRASQRPSAMHSYGLYAANGSLAATASSFDGSMMFQPIRFTAPGSYVYIIREMAGLGSGLTIDNWERRVVVTVTADQYGNLLAAQTSDIRR